MAGFHNICNTFNAPPAVAPKSSPKLNPGARPGQLGHPHASRPANPSSPSRGPRDNGGGGGGYRTFVHTQSEEDLVSKYDHGVMHHDTGVGKTRKNTYNFWGSPAADAASSGSPIPRAPHLPALKQRLLARERSTSPVPPEPGSHRAPRPAAASTQSVKRSSRGDRTPQRRSLPSKAELGAPPAKPPRPPGGLGRPGSTPAAVSPTVLHVPRSSLPPRQETLAVSDDDIYDDVGRKLSDEEQDEKAVPSDKDFRRRNGSGDYDDILTPAKGQVTTGDGSAQGCRGSGNYDDVWLPGSTCASAERDGYYMVGDSHEAIYDDIDNYSTTEDGDFYTDHSTRSWPDGAGTDAHVPMNSSQQGAYDKSMADWRKKSKERQPDKKYKTGNKELLQLQKKFNVHLSEDSPVMCSAEVIQPKKHALKKLELALAITDTIDILHLTDEYAICRNQHGKYGYVCTSQLHTSNYQELLSSEMYADVGTCE